MNIMDSTWPASLRRFFKTVKFPSSQCWLVFNSQEFSIVERLKNKTREGERWEGAIANLMGFLIEAANQRKAFYVDGETYAKASLSSDQDRTIRSKKAVMIPLQIELGRKDACLIYEDVDLDLAAVNIVKGGFSYSGQRCTSVKLVLVMKFVADALIKKVNEKVEKLTVGIPEENCDITVVVTESSSNFIEGLLNHLTAPVVRHRSLTGFQFPKTPQTGA